MSKQNLLAFPQASARITDPDSSHDAAGDVERSGRGPKLRQTVLRLVRAHPGRTMREISEFNCLDLVSISPRFKELVRANLIFRGKRRKCRFSHKSVLTWWPPPKGLETSEKLEGVR